MRFSLLLVSAFLFFSCKSDKEPAEQLPAVVKAAATPVDPAEQKLKDLRARTQIDLEKLAHYLPEKLVGIKRTNLTMSNNQPPSKAQADYIKNSSSDLRITVYDCAGNEGADLYHRMYGAKMAKAEKDSSIQTVDMAGRKALRKFEEDIKATTLTYMADDHVMVVLSFRNFTEEKVADAIKEIHE